MAPYEALYGRKCRSPLCWDEVGESKLFVPEIIQEMKDQVQFIRTKMAEAQIQEEETYPLKKVIGFILKSLL